MHAKLKYNLKELNQAHEQHIIVWLYDCFSKFEIVLFE